MRWAVGVLLVACGGASAVPAPVVVRRDAPAGAEAEPAAVETSPRALGPTATFADLVAAVRRLDDRGQGESDAGCLLRGRGEVGAAWRLEADLAVGVRPVPDPSPLAGRLADGGPVTVLTRWGRRGSGGVSFAALTTLPPPREGDATLVAITDDGILLRLTGEAVGASDGGPHRVSALAGPLSGMLERASAEVYVTAEPGTSLRRVREVLAALPADAQQRAALAVVLPDAVTLPEPPTADDAEGLCPEGLTPSGEDPGELDAARLRAALAPLAELGATCLSRAAPEAARGGRVELLLRVGVGGQVRQACLQRDGIGDPLLRACMLNAVRGLTLPDPAGDVDVRVPLLLAPDRSEVQKALCP